MLHYAVAYGQINAVKLLLEHGAGTYVCSHAPVTSQHENLTHIAS